MDRSGWAVRISVVGVGVVLFVVAGVNTERMFGFRRAYLNEVQASGVLRDSYRNHKQNAYSVVGREFKWPQMAEVTGTCGDGSPAACTTGPLVVVFYDELACGACQDDMTRLSARISARLGPQKVVSVVASRERRFVDAFVRVNQINRPVYHDRDGAFATLNQLPASPMIFLIDAGGKVLLAEHPIVGAAGLLEPFFAAAVRIVSQSCSGPNSDGLKTGGRPFM